jgi:tetratricopeptide (TPR) repeat protein
MGRDRDPDDMMTSELGSLAPLLRKVAATPGGDSQLALWTELAGRYTVVEFLGRGAMGAVYKVRDGDLDEQVALKLLHPELGADADYQQRLRAEVRIARRVSHPNVCRVHDLGQDGGRLFVTMELIRGRSLRAELGGLRTQATSKVAVMVDVIVQIASALAAAHRAGVLHRDIKPDNVVLEGSRAVLTDFGVASMVFDRDDQVVVGTPPYIAPEILRGEPSDHRADVYSTAVMAYELLTGGLPFPSRTLDQAKAIAAERGAPPPVSSTLGAPPLRAALDRAFARALDPDPATRIATAEQLAEVIAEAARGAGTTLSSSADLPIAEPRSMPTPTAPMPTVRHAETRVATALVYRTDRLRDSTRAVPAASGEDLERIIVDAGGSPLTVSGLEITALFGAPLSLGDDAERATRAAQALIALRGGRAGLDTVRFILRPGVLALSASDATSSAAALASAAAPEEILVSPVTARQIASRFDVSAVDLGGSSARRVTGARRPTPRADAATFRARELGALEALAVDCFTHRRPRHGEVRAPAGYGKTQLRDALMARLRERREIDWLVARATPNGDSGPLGLLRAVDPSWYAAAERAGLADRRAAFAAARRWLEVRAARVPVCLALEDVQWADEVSRTFLDELVTTLDDVPVLVITFVRRDDAEIGGPAVRGRDVIELGPLDPATAITLVRALAPGAPAEAVEVVVQRAAGHPFFLEELARDLAERGGAKSPGSLPATIEAVVQARLDRLAPAELELITAAAVVGAAFWRDALAPAMSAIAAGTTTVQEDATVDAGLAELERLALVAPSTLQPDGSEGGERYRFVHGVVRDVAYARVAPRMRRAAHAAVADWLARRFQLERTGQTPEPAVELVSALAHHLEQAGASARAAAAYRITGLRSLAAAANREAADALRRSAALAPAIDAELAMHLGDAVLYAETISDAEQWYQRALDLTAADDAAARALLWHKLGNAASRRADSVRAIQCFETGLALTAPGDRRTLAAWATRDPRTAALLFGSLGWVTGYQLGDNERGLPDCQRAVALLEGTPYRRELAHALSRLGATFMRAGRFRDQLGCNQRNLAIAIEIGDVIMQLLARVNLGVVFGLLGEIDEAIAHSEIARGLAVRSGARDFSGVIESNLAGYYLECGRLDDAQRCLDAGLVISDRAGSRAGLTESYSFVARLHAARGDLAGAERWARRSLALAEELEMRLDQGIALRILAQIEARTDAAAALVTIGDAVLRMAGLDAYEQARTEAARARILRRRGDDEAAAAARTAALAELTRLGACRELEVIDRLDEVR